MNSCKKLCYLLLTITISISKSFAGGPNYAVGNIPAVYRVNIVKYQTDQGLLGILNNQKATQIAINGFSNWASLLNSNLKIEYSSILSHDVTSPLDEYISGPNQFNDNVNPIVFDNNGDITDALLGVGAKKSVLGFSGSQSDGVNLTEGFVILCGSLAIKNDTLEIEKFQTVMTHEVGHFFGLAHSQISSHGEFPTMYPNIIDYHNQGKLKSDDITSLTLLYPNPTFSNSYGSITGNIYKQNNSPLSGINVIAVDANNGNLYSTVVDYFSGDKISFDQTQKPNSKGFFRIDGLPEGNYFIRIEPINSKFNGGSSVASYSTPINTNIYSEWYNGSNENGDMLRDNVNEKSTISVTNTKVTNVILIANESNSINEIIHHPTRPTDLVTCPNGTTTKYALKFNAPSNGSVVGIRLALDKGSKLPKDSKIQITLYDDLNGFPSNVIGLIQLKLEYVNSDIINDFWLRSLGRKINFKNGDSFYIEVTLLDSGSLVFPSAPDVSTRYRSYTDKLWQNYGSAFFMDLIYSNVLSPATEPQLELNPRDTMYFISRLNDSIISNLSIKNIGVSILNVNSIELIGKSNDKNVFSFNEKSNFKISSGTEIILPIKFSPQDLENSVSKLKVTSDFGVETITLIGKVLSPRLLINNDTLNFGKWRIGTTSNTLNTIIKNVGSDTLKITSGNLINNGSNNNIIKLISPNFDKTLFVSPTDSLMLSFSFSPLIDKSYSAILELKSNILGFNTMFNLTGIGISPKLNVNPSMLDFGNVKTIENNYLDFSLLNIGTDELRLSNYFITSELNNLQNNSFTISNPPTFPLIIQPDLNRDFKIKFTPTEKGSYKGLLKLFSIDPMDSIDIPIIGKINDITEVNSEDYILKDNHSNKLFIYPNIISNLLSFKINLDDSDQNYILNYKILNSLSKIIVSKEELVSNQYELNKTLDLSQFPNGVYLLIVEIERKKMISKFVILR